MLDELERIEAEPTGEDRKSRAFRIALEGGIRGTEARLAWLEEAIAEVRSPAWATRKPTSVGR